MSLRLKDLILPFSLALGVTFLIRYFFPDNKIDQKSGVNKVEQLESGRSHTAPRIQEVHRPLDTEIKFIETSPCQEAKSSALKTDYAEFVFSGNGAAIEQWEYKDTSEGKNLLLKIMNSQGKEDRALLVALNESTPFYYKLIDQNENAESFNLLYEADFDGGVLTKKFTVYKHQCKIDLAITVIPLKTLNEPVRVRVFYPAPALQGIAEDNIQGVFNEGNSIVKKTMTSLLQRYWEIPTLFGLEDRYFISAMVKDENNFSQRGYYKAAAGNTFFAVLEGPAIKEKASWNLSFYFGPKKIGQIAPVDPRLEKTLDYGYLGIIAKPLLAILTFFFAYFKSYGLAIILLTLLIKLLLLPFTLKGEQSMKKRLEFQRKLQYIQTKFKNDKEGLAQARAELLKKHGMPDIGGCLPLLFQLPIFIALNRVLSNSLELYKAPFLWIPDLSMKDPYLVLPVLIGLSVVIHSSATDAKQRLSTYAIALLLGAFSAGLPAGLSLFIFMSSILTVVQSKVYTLIKKA